MLFGLIQTLLNVLEGKTCVGFAQNSDIFYWVRQTDLTTPKEDNDPDLTMSSCKPNEDS